MNYTWTTKKSYKDIPENEYINDCCIGGDIVLNELKPEIAAGLGVTENDLNIYQEDWGWALEIRKDDVFYSLGISNNSDGGEETDFTVNLEATRKVKGFIFSKTVAAEAETNQFGGLLSKLGAKNGFEVKEDY